MRSFNRYLLIFSVSLLSGIAFAANPPSTPASKTTYKSVATIDDLSRLEVQIQQLQKQVNTQIAQTAQQLQVQLQQVQAQILKVQSQLQQQLQGVVQQSQQQVQQLQRQLENQLQTLQQEINKLGKAK